MRFCRHIRQDRRAHARNHEAAHEKGHEQQPIQQQVSDVQGHDRPGVRRQQSQLGRQVVAVRADTGDFRRLRARGHGNVECFEYLRVIGPMAPGGQPTRDITAARHTGQVMKAVQQTEACQALQHAQGEGGTANSSAGQAQRSQVDSAVVHGPRQLTCRKIHTQDAHLRPDNGVEPHRLVGGASVACVVRGC